MTHNSWNLWIFRPVKFKCYAVMTVGCSFATIQYVSVKWHCISETTSATMSYLCYKQITGRVTKRSSIRINWKCGRLKQSSRTFSWIFFCSKPSASKEGFWLGYWLESLCLYVCAWISIAVAHIHMCFLTKTELILQVAWYYSAELLCIYLDYPSRSVIGHTTVCVSHS